jgi:UDP-glucose 4-epimerase
LQRNSEFCLLTHLNAKPMLPQRTVVIGGSGFIGGAVVTRLAAERANVVSVTRRDINLLALDAAEKLTALLRPGDAIVAAAARVPCRDLSTLIDNMNMTKAMLNALADVDVSHVVNISSDAVYPDEPIPLHEKIQPGPTTLHGVMHLAREISFASEIKAPLAVLRPTLVYGADDPHNGYGPNRFLGQARAGKDIVLFGNGEERRDHILIEDVADLVARVLTYRSQGILNIATGTAHSFWSIAKKAIDLSANKVTLVSRPRPGPMPHKGYRPFDTAAVRAAFPDFNFTPLFEGMSKVHRAMTRY